MLSAGRPRPSIRAFILKNMYWEIENGIQVLSVTSLSQNIDNVICATLLNSFYNYGSTVPFIAEVLNCKNV